MKLFDLSLKELCAYIKRNPEIFLVCFGTGMVARHCEQLFCRYGLWDRAECFIDNDSLKWGDEFEIAQKKFRIYGPEELYNDRYKNALLMILCEDAGTVFEQLTADTKNVVKCCVSFPEINQRLIRETLSGERKYARQIMGEKEEKKIPAVIHYCWFGNREIPKEHKKYIENWKKLHPDYEIVFWNEDNYDVAKCLYMREAYESGYYAFVSDYARLDIVYQHGGFYLDTDIELIRRLESLRKYQIVMTYGKWPAVSSGCGFGAVAGNPLIREMRDDPRSSISFLDKRGRPQKITNCFFESAILEKEGFELDFTSQSRDGIQILSPYYFPSKPLWMSGKTEPEMIFGIHHDEGSWR